ncbi:hypothetical protein HU200_037846 [Digitaria exilis]|uniref:Uncharacterized protein n=1 Tax=Digitaria exilis TaxID=1010633 RepID=A0A835BAR5_9POAL|nr:hypothetical protein HU200_037846 [Digitaria exilis]
MRPAATLEEVVVEVAERRTWGSGGPAEVVVRPAGQGRTPSGRREWRGQEEEEEHNRSFSDPSSLVPPMAATKSKDLAARHKSISLSPSKIQRNISILSIRLVLLSPSVFFFPTEAKSTFEGAAQEEEEGTTSGLMPTPSAAAPPPNAWRSSWTGTAPMAHSTWTTSTARARLQPAACGESEPSFATTANHRMCGGCFYSIPSIGVYWRTGGSCTGRGRIRLSLVLWRTIICNIDVNRRRSDCAVRLPCSNSSRGPPPPWPREEQSVPLKKTRVACEARRGEPQEGGTFLSVARFLLLLARADIGHLLAAAVLAGAAISMAEAASLRAQVSPRDKQLNPIEMEAKCSSLSSASATAREAERVPWPAAARVLGSGGSRAARQAASRIPEATVTVAGTPAGGASNGNPGLGRWDGVDGPDASATNGLARQHDVAHRPRAQQQLPRTGRIPFLELFFNELECWMPSSRGARQLHRRHPGVVIYTHWLTGRIPAVLGNSTQLRVLSRYLELNVNEDAENQLTGPLPLYACAGGQLQYILVMSNLLTRPIPVAYAECTPLLLFRVSNNHLDVAVPASWTSPETGPVPAGRGEPDVVVRRGRSSGLHRYGFAVILFVYERSSCSKARATTRRALQQPLRGDGGCDCFAAPSSRQIEISRRRTNPVQEQKSNIENIKSSIKNIKSNPCRGPPSSSPPGGGSLRPPSPPAAASSSRPSSWSSEQLTAGRRQHAAWIGRGLTTIDITFSGSSTTPPSRSTRGSRDRTREIESFNSMRVRGGAALPGGTALPAGSSAAEFMRGQDGESEGGERCVSGEIERE